MVLTFTLTLVHVQNFSLRVLLLSFHKSFFHFIFLRSFIMFFLFYLILFYFLFLSFVFVCLFVLNFSENKSVLNYSL